MELRDIIFAYRFTANSIQVFLITFLRGQNKPMKSLNIVKRYSKLMKKLLFIFLLALSFSAYSQSVSEVYYPKYVQGVGSGSPSSDMRVPYASRMTLNGLTPNATYRFFTGFTDNPASSNNGAIGAVILANQSGNFTRITSPSVINPGEYGEFTTNASGSFTGWFVLEPSSDIMFTPGNQLYWRIMLNNGAGGVLVVSRLTAANPVTVINWGFTSGAALEGSAIYNVANAAWVPKNFVMLYDNIGGTGRPVTGTFIENDGTNGTTAEFYDLWYEFFVNGFNNVWGTIIPNNLGNGINNISQYSLASGNFVNKCTSPNGVYGTTDTRNASTGNDAFGTLLIIDCTPSAGCNITTSTTVTHVNCFGQSTGAVNLTVTGAIAPITYLWSNNATTEDISNVPAGTYSVTITDAANCTATATVTVTQPASALSATAVGTNVLCFGQATGAVNLTVTGGTTPYTFLWSNSATTEDISGLIAGIYSVTVTDNKGCTTAVSITITQPAAALATSSIITHVLCFGQNTGSVNLTVAGGTIPYTFLWSNGATTEDISGLIAGTYSVTVTDANGCTATASAIVTQPTSALSANATATNATCGVANGSINLTVTGGTVPYTFLWSNNATTEDISGLIAGTYSVTVTDANGCITTTSATVSNTGGANVSVTGTTNVLCFGQNTGSINITVTGGIAPYTYLWSNGATTEDISNLVAGIYSVTVTDAGSCTSTTSATITQPVQLASSAAAINATCGAANGSINLTVTGGIIPYTFLWSNNATTEDISGLVPGTYSVTVTDANGCTATASATVNNIAGPTASVTAINVLCFGQSTGSVNLTVTGGTAPFTFLWSNAATTEDISGLIAGTYTVTITDANGCTATASATITQPASALSSSATATNATCGAANGSVDLTVTGGTTPYTFLWSNAATTEDISGLVAGTYSVTITDANGCTSTASATVNNSGGPTVAVTNTTNILCFGQSTGSIDITVSSGTAPYTYLWSNGATLEDISGIPAGTYTVSVTDANNCTTSAGATITQPTAITQTATVIHATCGAPNGSINLTVSGGVSPYIYLWSNNATTEDITNLAAGTYSVTITDANGCTATASATVNNIAGPTTSAVATNVLCFGQSTGSIDLTVTGGTAPFTFLWSNGATTEDISGLVAGTYNVTVTDANACISTASATVTQPASALTASAVATNATCGNANGSVNLTVNGGTIPYTYLWNNSATTEDISGLVAGTYSVVITDANGCTQTSSATVNNIAGPTVTVSGTTNVLCFGQSTGSVNIAVTGGTAAFTYLWSNGATTQNLVNIPAGTYSVTVTDANACTATTSTTITQPNQLTASATQTAISCFGGNSTVIISGSGGTLPYTGPGTFSRSAGTYSFTITDVNGCTATVNVTITQPTQLTTTEQHTPIACFGGNSTVTINAAGGTAPYTGTGTFTRPAGIYNFTVTDANGCTSVIPVVITQPTAMVLTTSTGTIACNGGTTTITVSATGGTAPYTGTGTFTRTAGAYSYTVTDANGCTATISGTITQPSILIASALASTIACNGGNSTVTITATGGTAPYTGTGTFIRATGTYNFTVTDANGCTSVTTITITQPTTLIASATAAAITRCGGTTEVIVTASGGTSPYPYPGVGTYLRGPGTWTFNVVDAAGCIAVTEITIAAPECLKVYPNPARTNLYVSHSRATAGTMIQVIDITGRRMLLKQVSVNSILTTIDVSRFAGGSYMLIFYMNGEKNEIRFKVQ